MKITHIKQHTDLHLLRFIERPRGFKEFTLGSRFWVSYRVDGIAREVEVNEGFTTDLASVPRAARWFASKTDAIEESVVHDWMYEERLASKEEADALFLAMMAKYGVHPLRRRVMYQFVHWFGQGEYDD